MDTAVMVPLTPREAFLNLQGEAAILDIRPEYETDFRVFDVPRVIYLPLESLQEGCAGLPGDIMLIVADSVGFQSKEAARYLVEYGLASVSYLAGGIIAWERAGLPVSKDLDYEMSGGCACKLRPHKEKPEGSSVAPSKERSGREGV